MSTPIPAPVHLRADQRQRLARLLRDELAWEWNRAPGVPSAEDVTLGLADVIIAAGLAADPVVVEERDRLAALTARIGRAVTGDWPPAAVVEAVRSALREAGVS